MGDVPTTGQLGVLIAAMLVLLTGLFSSLRRWRLETRDPTLASASPYRVISKICLYAGTIDCIGVLIWHSHARGSWQPLEDNFGAFLWLAVLLSLFIIYTQRAHPLRGLDFFILPVVLLLLVLAIVFGKTKPHEYQETTWSIVHRVTAYGGFVAFAIAGAVGGMYLFANRRLRHKKLLPGQGFGSLERLEHITLMSVTLGFALLTVGLVTGLFRVLDPRRPNSLGPDWYRNPKVVLACVAWIVYALVLHSPINPAFRGRRTALLSVLGFVLMIGTFVAVQFMPGK
ncbi:MAG TPA: cytochrome c biogenesis protein CcsA [Humisphaera sp.]|nr:cytochrome c biogenesis protein CcsA [Humisphaera sp.]